MRHNILTTSTKNSELERLIDKLEINNIKYSIERIRGYQYTSQDVIIIEILEGGESCEDLPFTDFRNMVDHLFIFDTRENLLDIKIGGDLLKPRG